MSYDFESDSYYYPEKKGKRKFSYTMRVMNGKQTVAIRQSKKGGAKATRMFDDWIYLLNLHFKEDLIELAKSGELKEVIDKMERTYNEGPTIMGAPIAGWNQEQVARARKLLEEIENDGKD